MNEQEVIRKFDKLIRRVVTMWNRMESDERLRFILNWDEFLDEWEQFRWDLIQERADAMKQQTSALNSGNKVDQ